jgi:hypothetical protein
MLRTGDDQNPQRSVGRAGNVIGEVQSLFAGVAPRAQRVDAAGIDSAETKFFRDVPTAKGPGECPTGQI